MPKDFPGQQSWWNSLIYFKQTKKISKRNIFVENNLVGFNVSDKREKGEGMKKGLSYLEPVTLWKWGFTKIAFLNLY